MDSLRENWDRPAERSDVESARAGDEAAFERLVAHHRPALLAHCYSMLGSLPDAEDAVQDAFVRAWRHLDSFRGDAGLGSWLHRVATNVCLTALDRGRRRDLPVDLDQADAESDGLRWLGLFPTASWPVERVELRESVELAFAAALQHLPPRQRAVLLLRDVLGYSARETAEMLDITPTAAHSALQHARSSVTTRVSGTSQQRSLRALGDTALRDLVDRYVRALESGDVRQVLALLTDDATWSMPPSPTCFRGHGEIAEFLREGPLRDRWRHVPTSVNAQLAVACYAWDDDHGAFVGRVVDVLTVRDSRIAAVTAFVDAGAFAVLQLPSVLR